MSPTNTPVLIIGAGPAGLAVAACLREHQLDFHIIEQANKVGWRWHNHYERLHLHTARDYSALPHMGFAKGTPRYPSRQQVVEYLDAYAENFGINPQFDTELRSLHRNANDWHAITSKQDFQAGQVVLCTGYNRVAQRPDFAPGSSPQQIHSRDYRNADSIAGPRNLVVGAGNSGAEIALDLAESGRDVDMAIRGPLNVVPKEVLGLPLSTVTRFSRWLPDVWAEKLSQRSMQRLYGDLPDYGIESLPYGVQCQVDQHQRVPLIDIGTIDAIRRGEITVRPGVKTLTEGQCTYTDGSVTHYDGVVLATGFRPRLEDLLPDHNELLNAAGAPHSSGEALAEGLFSCGFRISTRGMLNQIGREARRIARAIANTRRSPMAGN
ncbi:MAG: flavin-containing monooxygenase [Lysobacterales bacterium]